jgi:hypothetical protein
MRHAFTVLAFVALSVLAACSGSDAEPTPEASTAPSTAVTTTSTTVASTGDSAQRTATIDVPPPPEYYALTLAASVAAPGDSITVEADGEPSTPLRLIGSAGIELESSWTGNGSTVELPASLSEGLYLLQIEGQPSFATLRVVSDASLYLTTERSYIPSQEGVTLHASSSLAVDDLIAWLVVETDEMGFGGVPVEQYFSPTSSGALAAIQPKPLAEFLGRPLRLPSGVIGSMRIMAGTEETFLAELGVDEYESNRISIGRCDEGSLVNGTTAGPALVRAFWSAGGLRTAGVSADGDYQIATGAGAVLVSIVSLATDDGPASPEYFAVNAPCEDSVNVVARPGVGIAAGPPIDRVSQLASSLAPAAAGSSSEVCRTVFVSPIKIEGREGDWGPYVASEIAKALPNTSVISQWDADQITAFEALRQSLDAGDDELLEQLGKVTGSADFIVTGRVRELLGEASVALFSFHRRPTDVDASGSWSGGPLDTALLDRALPELIDGMRTSAICGNVSPPESSIESDETVELTYELSDLAGDSVNGASVTISPPSLGTLDPDSGTTEGGAFDTTFTPEIGASGSLGLEFSAEWDSPSGKVRTREDESRARISIDADWRIHIEASESQADFGSDGYTNFVWDGEFTVDAEGVVEGSGSGAVEMGGSCYIDGALVEGPFRIPGSFSFNISGERTYSNEPDFIFGFTGTHFQMDAIQPTPVSELCQLLGLLGQGLGGELARVIAHNPQYLPVEGEGSLILPVAAGTTSFETWSGSPFIVTLEGVTYD